MLKHQSDPSGKISLINGIMAFGVFLFNLMDQIIKGQNIVDRIGYTAPFLIIAIICLTVKSKYINTLAFLFIAISTTLFANDVSNYSGALPFLFAYHQFRSKRFGMVILAITVVSISMRAITMGDTIPGNLIMVAVYMWAYAIYYICIKILFPNGAIAGLTKKEMRLLDLLAEGKIQKEIAGIMGVSNYDVWNMVKKIKEKTGYISLDQVMFNYGNKQITENSN